ncbi:MAG: DOPA 4,5-dioxygenase family protein [Pseudomonadota bacterium]
MMPNEYHAHVYFDASTLEQAKALCEEAAGLFPLEMGRVHEKPVGPHPMWSCQLAFKHEAFADIIAWLALNRNGLVVFIHPETGDVIRDHTEHAMWMGDIKELKLSALQ